MIKKLVFTKCDNGSHKVWREWDGGEVKGGYLYSVAELYMKVSKQGEIWRINYRLNYEGISLPKFFSLDYDSQDGLRESIRKFMDWALENRRLLIELQERHEQ